MGRHTEKKRDQGMMESKSGLARMLAPALMALALAAVPSCTDEDEYFDDVTQGTEGGTDQGETFFMYMPWSGSSLYTYLLYNITGFERAIEANGGLGGNNLVVFVSSSGTSASLINVRYADGKCSRDTVKSYSFATPEFTTAEGIAGIMGDMVQAAPAGRYSLLVGSHGMGWIPTRGASGLNAYNRARRQAAQGPLTRYFGSDTDSKYQTDITTLAEGILQAGIRMGFILFDDCYMSNVETAYDLREATDYLIASTCEIMMEGMPYETMGIPLMNHDYGEACRAFLEFYTDYSPQSGTLGVTDCSQVEAMADIMREINLAYPDGVQDTGSIQDLDGYSPTIFFDFGSYVETLCRDEGLLADFNARLGKLVPHKVNTPSYYSMFTTGMTPIESFSGLTVSDPSTSGTVTPYKDQTAWYKATH